MSGRKDALRLPTVLQPDFAFVDRLPSEDDCLALWTDLHGPGVRVVVSSSHEEPAFVSKRDIEQAYSILNRPE